MDMRRTVLSLLACGLALPLAACSASPGDPPAAGPTTTSASPATPSATPPATPSQSPTTPGGNPPPPVPVPPPGKPTYVSLERSGGIAGRIMTLVVQPNGRWLFTGGKPGEGIGKPLTGQLNPEQLRKLQALLADPKLVAESRVKRAPTNCRDAFHYTLSTGALLVSWDSCARPDEPPTATAIARLLSDATPL